MMGSLGLGALSRPFPISVSDKRRNGWAAGLLETVLDSGSQVGGGVCCCCFAYLWSSQILFRWFLMGCVFEKKKKGSLVDVD